MTYLTRKLRAECLLVDDVPQGEPEDDAAHDGEGFMDVGEKQMHPDAEWELVKDFIVDDVGAEAEESSRRRLSQVLFT